MYARRSVVGRFVRPTLLILLSLAAAASAAAERLVIDGRFDDWADAGEPTPVEHIGAVSAAAFPGALFLRFDLDRERNIDRLDGSLRVAIDSDGAAKTGWSELEVDGVDVVMEIPPSAGLGAALRRSPPELNAKRFGAGDGSVLLAPTHASDRFEMRLSLPEAKRGGRVRLAVALTGAKQGSPTQLALETLDQDPPPAVANPFARPAGTDFRVVLWNVYKLRLRQRPEGFVRVLQALNPDVILLSEVAVSASEDELDELFEQLARRGKWDLVLGSSGQLQRSIIAGRMDTDEVDGFELLEYPAAGRRAALEGDLDAQQATRVRRLLDGGVSATAAEAKAGDEDLLAVVADLTCCGRAGGREDRIREAEATAIGSQFRSLLRGERFEGAIIAGDFNLVASRGPLDALRRRLDPSGADLAIAEALTLDGAANYTWRQPGSLFPPGRLDYLLYSSSSLEVLSALVVETEKIDAGTLERFGVRESDTAADVSSDHLPLVVDFAWKRD